MDASQTLTQLLEATSIRAPATTLHFPALGEALCLGELAEQSRAFAGALLQQGLQKGQLVALLLPTSADFLIAFFGILQAGGAVAPLPCLPTLKSNLAHAERLKQILRDAEVRLAVVQPSFGESLSRELAHVRLLRPGEPPLQTGRPREVSVTRSDLALVQYTSGSTAAPKGVALTHANVMACIRAIITQARITDTDVNVQWLPLYHDMGLIGTLTGLAAGVRQYLWPPSAFIRSPARWLSGFARCRGTIYSGPSFSYDYLLDNVAESELGEIDLSSWRIAFNGGEPVDAACLERFTTYFGKAGFKPETMLPVYGLAEATLAVAFPDPGHPPLVQWVDADALANGRRAIWVSRSHRRARAVVAVGRAMPGHAVRIVGKDGEGLPEQAVGEIQVNGPAVMTGYYGKPRESRQVLSGGWLRTGDLGYMSAGCLFVTGRTKEMIIVHGINYYPQDVEMLVCSLRGIHRGQCVAFAVPRTGEERMAIVAETKLTSTEDRDRLVETIRSRIASQLGLAEVEVHLVRAQTIERTTSGKYQRLLMRDRLLAERLEVVS